MSLTCEVPPTAFVSRRIDWMRLTLLAGVLVTELMALTIRYDAQSLVGQGWLSQLAVASRNLPQILVVALVAFAIAQGARRSQPGVQAAVPSSRSRKENLTAWSAHLLSFLAFFTLTAPLLEGSSESRLYWLAPWWVAGLATAMTAALIARPYAELRRIFIASRPFAIATGLIALGAWGFAKLTPILWGPLGGATYRLVSSLLSLFFTDIVVDPRTASLGTSRFAVRIAPECSGYEGIGLVLIFLTAFLWLSRRSLRFPTALLLLPIGVVAIWVTNALRITGLIMLGTLGSPSVALGGFHSQAGWLAFNAVGLCLVLLARRSPVFVKPVALETAAGTGLEASDEPQKLTFGPTAAYLAPILALVLASMIGSAFSSGFDRLYPLRVFLVLAAFWLVRGYGRTWSWTWSWSAVGIGVVVFAIWMAMEPTITRSAVIDDGLASLSPFGRWTWLLFRIFGSVITVPIAEELAFRGYVPRRLTSTDFESVPLGRFSILTLLVSSTLFGLMHGRAVAGTIAGAAYALALTRRGKLGDAILAHATTNLLIAAYVMMTGQTSLWS